MTRAGVSYRIPDGVRASHRHIYPGWADLARPQRNKVQDSLFIHHLASLRGESLHELGHTTFFPTLLLHAVFQSITSGAASEAPVFG